MSDPIQATPQSPVLPPEPWYKSPVQRAQVFAALSSIAAIAIPLFGFNIDISIINAKLGLVAQLVNLGFTLWGIMRRSNSSLQPLTLTKAGAAAKSDTAQVDPSTLSKTPQAGFAKAGMLALLLAVSLPVAVFMPGCSTYLTKDGTQRPATFEDRIHELNTGIASARDTVRILLNAGKVSIADAERFQSNADNVRSMSDIAASTGSQIDLESAQKLLTALETEINERKTQT